MVDTGIDKRVVVSGIAEHYSPEDVVGKKVSVKQEMMSLRNLPFSAMGIIEIKAHKDVLIFAQAVDFSASLRLSWVSA